MEKNHSRRPDQKNSRHCSSVAFLLLFFTLFVVSSGCGKSLEERYGEKYNICGKHIIEKEIGGLKGTVKEPSLFIYLLQHKTQPNNLMISVTQKNGYSVSDITIRSNMLQQAIEIKGKGKYWGDKISSKFKVDSKTYEKEIVVPQGKIRPHISFTIEVTYWWIWRGKNVPPGKFVNYSDTTRTTLSTK